MLGFYISKKYWVDDAIGNVVYGVLIDEWTKGIYTFSERKRHDLQALSSNGLDERITSSYFK